MKALVVSGGGAYGAYAGGIVEYLIKDLGRDYDILLGTSTGSLLTPLLATGSVDQVKRGYLSVEQEDIFTRSPFKVNGDKRGKFKFFNILFSIIFGKRSLGDTRALEVTLRKFMSQQDYQRIVDTGKMVGCCVSNLSYGRKEYKFTSNWGYDNYIKWMHASSSVPPFMSVIEHDGNYYVDGGVTEHTPMQKAIDLGASEIDAIVLRKAERSYYKSNVKNLFNVIQQALTMMMEEISYDDVEKAQLQAMDKDVTINAYYRPGLHGGSLVFSPEVMRKNWTLGYKNAQKKKFKRISLAAHSRTPIVTYNGLAD